MSRPNLRTRKFNCQGNALGPVLLILAALAISSVVFFFFTKKRMDENKAQEAAAVAEETEIQTMAASTTAPVAPAPTTATPAPPPGMTPAPVLAFSKPVDVGTKIASSMAAGDAATAAKVIAGGDTALEAAAMSVLEKMKELGYKPGPADQVQMLGQAENAMRLSIPLQKADGTPTDARLLVDVVKDATMGWKVGTLRLPKELEAALAGMPPAVTSPAAVPTPAGAGLPVPPLPGTPMASGKPFIVVDATPDALTFASDFVRALLKPDYDSARKLVDETKVPAVKLAGLCIVFEDGQYELQVNRPLITTVATENTSWIIAKLQSATMKEETEFGLEMEKSAAGWRVIGLNLSQLLGDSAKASSQIGVPYTPLVKNPKGGESIALYYEYDQAAIHPRAQKQLAIVADILKSSPGKKLKIGGYTDAKGTDDYNLDLSKKRAEAVKQFFLDQGVPIGQVETLAFGKSNPLGPNANPDGSDNPEGRSLNRRAEILLDF